jgi:putative transposase
MTKNRRKFSPQFKFDTALEAVKEMKTIAQISSERGVHPHQISQWKRRLIEEGPSVFGKDGSDARLKEEAIQAELFEQIGRLKMDLEWLKKKSA